MIRLTIAPRVLARYRQSAMGFAHLGNQVRMKSLKAAAAAAPAIEPSLEATSRHSKARTSSKAAAAVVEEVEELEEEEEEQEVEREPTEEEIAAQELFDSLATPLKKSLTAMGISSLFPVQVQTLEACRAGEDMVVRSKTGSGKTMAFALPTVERILKEKASGGRLPRSTPRAIVLAPTRELALQVHREFEKIAPNLNSVAVYGGAPVGGQAERLREVVDVVIGTPGRVKDFLDRGSLKLDQIQVAILDEADEMLKVGFYEAIQEIYEAMPEKSKRQNLLFSATVSREIRKICQDFLNKPTFIDLVGDDTSKIPDTVEMCTTAVTSESKKAALSAILSAHAATSTKENPRRALIFCSTKRECEELARTFHSADAAISGGALHGDMSQSVREDMLRRFRDGSCLVLVATDVAARGLDIPEVDLVVHYSIPRDQDSFVHRSGRTGRAGRKGRNIILYDPKYENSDIRNLERSVGQRFLRRAVPCGPEVVRQQGETIASKLVYSGALLQWLKPVADVLREQDAKNGTDSLAAALAAIMGGTDRIKLVSALNGRSGNQTVKLESTEGKKLSIEAVTQFLKDLPSAKKSERLTVVRDFHRLRSSEGVLVDVPEMIVGDVMEHAKGANLEAEVIDGIVPESVSEYQDTRSGNSGGSSRRYGDRGGNRDYRGGDRGGDRRSGGRSGGYGGQSGRRNEYSPRGGSGSREQGSWQRKSYRKDY